MLKNLSNPSLKGSGVCLYQILLSADIIVPCPEDFPHLVKELGFLIYGCANRQNFEDGNRKNFFYLLQCAENSNIFLIFFDLRKGLTHTSEGK